MCKTKIIIIIIIMLIKQYIYQRRYVVDDVEGSIGNEVAFEEEGESVGSRNCGKTGEELYTRKIIRCTIHA